MSFVRDPKADRLAEIEALSTLDRRELRRILDAFDEIDVDAGTTLCRAGEYGRESFFIEQGQVAVVVDGVVVETLGPGDIAGELAPLGTERRTASLVTRTDCRLAVTPGYTLRHLVSSLPQVRGKVEPVVHERTH